MADDFFCRCGLVPESARAVCWGRARSHCAGAGVSLAAADIREASAQGYCSYTLFAGPSLVLQFRSPRHQIDLRLATLARDVYGSLAPHTELLGVVDAGSSESGDGDVLYLYSMTRLPGISLSELRVQDTGSSSKTLHETLVRGFARFLCRGWKSAREATSLPLVARGQVGYSLRWRLEAMHRELPERFRPVTSRALETLDEVEGLPWVLTHGDIVPGNVMVEGGGTADPHGSTTPPRGTLLGLLDWAEAEYLPFGVGLYGAEELFGQVVSPPDSSSHRYPPPRSRFAYYQWAGELRRILWDELRAGIPELAGEQGAVVERARILGILLWHGIAFDDGRLDRVVREGRDDEEIQRLDLFLLGSDAAPRL